MKLYLRFTVMILVLALFPAAGMFAANDSHKGDATISAPVQVAGKKLPAGEYTIKWDGTGPTAQVSFIRDRQVVATVPAKVVTLDQKANRDAVEVKTASNGDRTLTAIRFEGKNYVLEIGEGAGAADAASGDSVK